MRPAIHIRPWVPGDETAFEQRPDMAAEFKNVAWLWTRGAPGPTWAVVRFPGEVIGVGGGWGVRRPDGSREAGAFQVWCLLADVPRGDWPQLLDCARAALGQLETQHGAKRISALVREGFAGGERVLERLGFTRSSALDGPFDWAGYRVMARGL